MRPRSPTLILLTLAACGGPAERLETADTPVVTAPVPNVDCNPAALAAWFAGISEGHAEALRTFWRIDVRLPGSTLSGRIPVLPRAETVAVRIDAPSMIGDVSFLFDAWLSAARNADGEVFVDVGDNAIHLLGSGTCVGDEVTFAGYSVYPDETVTFDNRFGDDPGAPDMADELLIIRFTPRIEETLHLVEDGEGLRPRHLSVAVDLGPQGLGTNLRYEATGRRGLRASWGEAVVESVEAFERIDEFWFTSWVGHEERSLAYERTVVGADVLGGPPPSGPACTFRYDEDTWDRNLRFGHEDHEFGIVVASSDVCMGAKIEDLDWEAATLHYDLEDVRLQAHGAAGLWLFDDATVTRAERSAGSSINPEITFYRDYRQGRSFDVEYAARFAASLPPIAGAFEVDEHDGFSTIDPALVAEARHVETQLQRESPYADAAWAAAQAEFP